MFAGNNVFPLSLRRTTGWMASCLAVVMMHLTSPVAAAHGTHDALMKQANEELAEQPTDGGKWYKRALLQFDHEDWPESLSDLEKTEELAPGAFPVLWMRGQISDKQGKPTEAKARFDEFLSSSPTHWGALASRARVEVKLGLHDAALEDYRQVLANNPKPEPEIYNEVAQALAARNLTDEALVVLENGGSRLGSISSLQMRALEIEVSAERWDAALVRVDAIQKSALRPEPWMMKRASIFAAAGRLGESRVAWQSLIAHLAALPASERDSHSMSLIAEQAHKSLTILAAAPAARSPFAFLSKP